MIPLRKATRRVRSTGFTLSSLERIKPDVPREIYQTNVSTPSRRAGSHAVYASQPKAVAEIVAKAANAL
jgi:hypothetical protein